MYMNNNEQWDQKKYPLFDTTVNEILDFINTIIIKKDEDVTKEYGNKKLIFILIF